MPIETNDRIDREVKATHGLRFRHIEWTTTFRCITDTTTLIIIDRDEVRQQKHRSSKSVYWLYVTNMSVTDGNVADICRFYDARWGIESGYRIDDHEFTGLTTSHNESLHSGCSTSSSQCCSGTYGHCSNCCPAAPVPETRRRLRSSVQASSGNGSERSSGLLPEPLSHPSTIFRYGSSPLCECSHRQNRCISCTLQREQSYRRKGV
jgi:hypothetical protein